MRMGADQGEEGLGEGAQGGWGVDGLAGEDDC